MKDRILERIHRDGPMRFDTYMELSLYDAEDGFFSAGGLRPGVEGDFVTSPEVSPWFGRLLGSWASTALPDSDPLFIEVGAGSGSLVAAAVDSSARTYRSTA